MPELIANDPDAATVERAARQRLQNCGHEALKHIACHFRRGTMILKGSVTTYYHKQLAQEAVRELGDVGVVNDIRVLPR